MSYRAIGPRPTIELDRFERPHTEVNLRSRISADETGNDDGGVVGKLAGGAGHGPSRSAPVSFKRLLGGGGLARERQGQDRLHNPKVPGRESGEDSGHPAPLNKTKGRTRGKAQPKYH